ncbi:alanine/glycine:cation symporter family protein [Peptococcus simiae]|uniref:alanine/glycine:cation symporter family protein n=1 Tax=Peptococcus simiae TaxID=1643805 RepID=UPI0039807D07
MELLVLINSKVGAFVWGPIMLTLLLGTGLYLSIRGGFIQFRHFAFALKKTLGSLFGSKKGREREAHNISPFQAVSTALASTVGTGNIVGVATAITLGGPGAVFWMWVSALLGMMTKYSEIVLAVKFREKNKRGEYVGGPMYYIANGLKIPWLGAAFAFFAAFASFGIGNMTQANSIAGAVESSFGVSPTITGVVLAVIVAIVIIGGINSIARVTEIIVPGMALFYITFSLIVLVLHAAYIPEAIKLIFTCAFAPQSVLGGGVGYTLLLAIRYGVARGVFSNEAGLGSAPIAHAASSTKEPVEQGLWGIFEVFIDTIVVCSMTALVILTTIDSAGRFVWQDPNLEGAALTLTAFKHGLPGNFGAIGLTLGLTLFAVSTIFGWSYYGDKAVEYLFRKTRFTAQASLVYRLIFVCAVFLGSIGGLHLVWDIADTLNGLMAIPNLIGVLLLSGVVIKETKSYFSRLKNGSLD